MPKVKHKYTSAKADGPDSTFVRPRDWNDEHDLNSEAGSVYLGRTNSGAGPVLELPVVSAGGGDDFTMYTKAQVDAVIAAAISGVSIGDPGDLCASMRSTKTGWLLLDGKTIGNVGSAAIFANASAQALFTVLWGLNGNTWPVVPARGASAATDWAALATIALPDARGCTIAMVDLLAGVNALIASLGIGYAKTGVSLDITNIPSHIHPMNTPSRPGGNAGIGGGGGGASLWDTGGPSLAAGPTGGDPGAVPPYSVPKAFVPNQPTLGANIFIKL